MLLRSRAGGRTKPWPVLADHRIRVTPEGLAVLIIQICELIMGRDIRPLAQESQYNEIY